MQVGDKVAAPRPTVVQVYSTTGANARGAKGKAKGKNK